MNHFHFTYHSKDSDDLIFETYSQHKFYSYIFYPKSIILVIILTSILYLIQDSATLEVDDIDYPIVAKTIQIIIYFFISLFVINFSIKKFRSSILNLLDESEKILGKREYFLDKESLRIVSKDKSLKIDLSEISLFTETKNFLLLYNDEKLVGVVPKSIKELYKKIKKSLTTRSTE